MVGIELEIENSMKFRVKDFSTPLEMTVGRILGIQVCEFLIGLVKLCCVLIYGIPD